LEAARRATEGDRDAIVALAEQAIAELTPTKGGALWARREARLVPVGPSVDADLASAEVEVVVGTFEDVVLGYGIVHRERLRDGDLLAVVDDLYVDPEARGVAIGEAMMDLMLEWCSDQGCIGVDAIALPGNRETKNFFERFGLTARAIVVHRSLVADDPTGAA
jgi:GNAT superfamily N-acetyltransferase